MIFFYEESTLYAVQRCKGIDDWVNLLYEIYIKNKKIL